MLTLYNNTQTVYKRKTPLHALLANPLVDEKGLEKKLADCFLFKKSLLYLFSRFMIKNHFPNKLKIVLPPLLLFLYSFSSFIASRAAECSLLTLFTSSVKPCLLAILSTLIPILAISFNASPPRPSPQANAFRKAFS
jgi:hypothetical protein